MAFHGRIARGVGLTAEETGIFRSLSTPQKIQDYITAMPSNAEAGGDTCYSARLAIRRAYSSAPPGLAMAAPHFEQLGKLGRL